MTEKQSALYSEYIIDGVPQKLTPAAVLDACLCEAALREGPVNDEYEAIVDESRDPDLKPCRTVDNEIELYASMTESVKTRAFPTSFPESYSCCRIATALLDKIWKQGHFRLGDLNLGLEWKWNSKELGSMDAFYSSVCSAAEYIDALGLKISSYRYEHSTGVSAFAVKAGLSNQELDGQEDFFEELPFKTEHPRLGRASLHPSHILPDPHSWLIYIPFDVCEYRMGGSTLAQAQGVSGSVAPNVGDADYFMDCYEVVRELVEDRIVLAGVTVGDGGLYSALSRMVSDKAGMSVDLSSLAQTNPQSGLARLLFAEVPGVVIQIADIDYDYVDAELLLQDVAFYPLGHPDPDQEGVRILSSDRSAIHNILESIIRSQSSEGED